MTLGSEHSLAHARAIQARGMALPSEGLPAVSILDSWARCMDAGLNPHAAVAVPVVEAADLARRRDRAAVVRALAQAELETLSRQIAGSNFLLAFADHEGVILDLYADNRFSMSGSNAGILPGSCWREGLAGTNGLGTALATGSAVAVTGLEHYFLKLGDVSCTAAPVRDAQGQVVGVLDASSFYESRQRHTQALVQMAATHIENGLLTHQVRGQLVLAVHPRAEYLGTLSAALLAFDGDGCLAAINTPGRSLFSGLNAQLRTRFEDLFLEPLDAVLARLHLGADVRLRDALGSAVVARMVGRPTVGTQPIHLAPRALAPADDGASAFKPEFTPARTRERPPAPTSKNTGSEPALPFLADDPAVAAACRTVQAAVRLRAPILLNGETGTGKEMLARHAHQASGRRGAFVAVNCAALPAELFEAELFGYASGAFTGSRREGSAGLIVAADGGTLLLDEVRELPLQLQAALLRFLDDQQVRPVGSQHTRQVDVQLLAATHADLEEAVRAKTFREDLLYRLNTVRVSLPPLRSRRDFAAAVRCTLRTIDTHADIDDAATALLAQQRWPGNFRELRAVLTRALLSQQTAASEAVVQRPGSAAVLRAADISRVLPMPPSSQPQLAPGSVLQRSAAELVRAEYERTGRSVSQTSRNLAISRTTVYRHLKG